MAKGRTPKMPTKVGIGIFVIFMNNQWLYDIINVIRCACAARIGAFPPIFLTCNKGLHIRELSFAEFHRLLFM
jgi:hypothetical protein